jgi:hypothetical protein
MLDTMHSRSRSDRRAQPRSGRNGRRSSDRLARALALLERIAAELAADLPDGLAARSRALVRRDALAARAFRLAFA